jgi:two-component system, cell cycle sensor histidine kinase and response regulator CckA
MINLKKDIAMILDFVPIPVVGWDKDLNIIYWNGRAENEFGKNITEVLEKPLMKEINKSLQSFAEEEKKQKDIKDKNDLQKDPPTVIQRTELQTIHSDTRAYEWVSFLLDSNSPIRGLSMAKDISRIELLRKKMLESRRLATVGQLIGRVSHEANNLLMEVMCGLSAAENNSRDVKVLDDINVAMKGAKKIKNLLKSLLSNMRKIKGEKNLFDVNESVKDVVEFSGQILPKKVKVTAKYTDSKANIIGDQDQLHQILLNLIINARDSMDDKGKINIEVKKVLRPEKDEKEKEYVSISISDTGCGMSETVKDKIFELFFTTKSGVGGTGLGLYFVYNSVKEMGGWIEVESQENQGSTFTIFIPKR